MLTMVDSHFLLALNKIFFYVYFFMMVMAYFWG